MGRGRAKAKQTKVARKLKYQTLDTDLEALQRELSGDAVDEDDEEYDDVAYDEYVEDDETSDSRF